MDSDQKRAFLAVALSAVVLFGWQFYFAPKESEVIKPGEPAAQSRAEKVQERQEATPGKEEIVRKVVVDEAEEASKVVQAVTLKNNKHIIRFNSRFEVTDFQNPNSFLTFEKTSGEKKNIFIEAAVEGGTWAPLFFEFTQTSDHQVSGFDSRHGINLNGNLDQSGKFSFNFQSSKPLFYRITLKSSEIDEDRLRVRRFLYFTSDLNDVSLGSDDDAQGKLKWIGLDYNYHLLSFLFSEKIDARANIYESGRFTTTFASPRKALNASMLFTKKSYDHLSDLGDNLNRSVDFGFFGIISIPLLRGLQFIYEYIPNYGVAIIILTLLIRLLTFPLQFKSFKSMKKMQKVQPEMQKLREKYKDDPQRMQQETMALFKRAGANPLGGCLPMLMQMPIFFAFYQLLANSVELVGADFAFHISDLSAKDPYYILPVLMGLAMFGQMKLNPSTSADPTQQKVMMFMPIIFTFFMKDLPAGLNLYFFFSTLFGIAQQLFVYKTVDA